MRKVTKEYEVYKFEELEKDTQERLLEECMEEVYERYCECQLNDDMRELAKELLKENFKGAEYQEVYYDLSYSQGCGSMIEFDIDLVDLNEKYNLLKVEELNKCVGIGWTNIQVKHRGHYYHENSFVIDYNDYTDYDDEFEEIQDKIEDMIELFEKDIVLMNKELTKEGYSMLENRDYFEEEAMQVINELEFLKTGRVFNE